MAKYDKVISPGQEGKIVLEIDGAKVHGNFSKSASIHTNDPRHLRMTITLKGIIKRYIDVIPNDRVHLSGMYGEKVEKEVTIISNEEGKNFEINKIESNIDDKVTYKLYPGDEPRKYRLKIWKNPKLPALKTWGSITLHTNSEKAPQKVLQVNVTTQNIIKAQPSIINFGRIRVAKSKDGGAPASYEKTITVSKLKGEFSIKDVVFTSDYYSATVEQLEKGRRYSVTVRFSPDKVRRNYTDQMIINTDDPREPTIKVRLIARSI